VTRRTASCSRLFLFVSGAVACVHAQAPPTLPQFEVASVRACPKEAERARGARKGNGQQSSPDRLHLNCQTLLSLIQWGYVSFADGRFNPLAFVPLSGGPAWIDSDLFTIDAKAESPQSWGTMNGPMLRALLQQRFNLKTHMESREIPVYELTIAKGGPKLQPSKRDCIPFDPEHPDVRLEPGKPLPALCGMSRLSGRGWEAFAVTMADFATLLSNNADRKVVDRTRLSGIFDIHLDLSAEDFGTPSRAAADSEPPVSRSDPAEVFAIIRGSVQKLGLKLQPSTGRGDHLLVDRAERPSEN
jgi:uncharacterized protein (TIGR03435 family)